ncbi:MAG: histidine phosphatase family protein [Thermodesulfobacteriota bacterium]
MTKKLILVRHAKSSWKDSTLNDIQRPLNKRGNKDAPKMGEHLAQKDIWPDAIFSSPGLRALTTARLISVKIGIEPSDINIIDKLYTFSSQDLLEVVLGLDDNLNTLMLVGHNPAITDAVNYLSGSDIDNVPTCGIAVLKLSTQSWSQASQSSAELVRFDYPKKLW